MQRGRGQSAIFGELDSLKARLTKRPENTHRQVSQSRQRLSQEEQVRLLRWILARPHISRRLLPLTPQPLNALFNAERLLPVGLAKQLRWTTEVLIHEASRLTDFVDRSTSYYQDVLLDRFASAASALDSIDQDHGASVWALKQRIFLLQSWKGLDAQKQYAQGFWSSDASPITRLIAYFVSSRNEPSTTYSGFVDWMNRFFDQVDWSGSTPDYLRLQGAPHHFIAESKYELLLRVDGSVSVIDAYETTVNVSIPLLISGVASVQDVVADRVVPLLQTTRDRRGLVAGQLLASQPTLPDHAAEAIAASLFSGHTADAVERAFHILASDPLNIDVWTLAVQGCARMTSDPNGEFATIQNSAIRMGRLLRSGDTSSKDSLDLRKLATNLFGTPLSTAILGFLSEAGRAASLPLRTNEGHLAALNAQYSMPIWLPSIPDLDDSEAYSAPLSDRLPDSASRRLTQFWTTGDTSLLKDLPVEHTQLLLTHRPLAISDYEAALASASGAGGLSPYVQRRLARLRCECLLVLNRLQECVAELTSYYIADPSSHDILPVGDVCGTCKDRAPVSFADEISVPIIFDIYSQRFDKAFDSERAFAYSEFLKAQSVRVPTELASIQERFPLDKLIYFLRHVAIESVMARSRHFRSSRAVLEERLNVCRLLVELDLRHADAYQAEIRDLLRRQTIQQRMRQVEQHKIYVDLDSLRRTARTKFRETFERYQDLRRVQPEREETSAEEVLSAVKKAQAGNSDELASLRLPSSPTAELLKQIVIGLRDEFLSSPEHGLDKYLSVRIRHGTFAAQLRAPLESARLLTTREASTGRYQRNPHWPERTGAAPDAAARIEQRLAEFSAEFDRWSDEWLAAVQITTKADPDKMFDFSIIEPEMRLVAAQVTPDTTFDGFMSFVIEQLFNVMLDRDLELARERIRTVLKPDADRMLQRLADDVTRLISAPRALEMVDAIRAANTELQNALDRVTAWFYRTDTVLAEPFTITDAILISAETVRAVSPQFTVHGPGHDLEWLQARGRQFNPFVDVFILIFQNVVRHAGLQMPTATVQLAVSDDRTSMSVTVTNEVEPKIITAAARDRVLQIKADMESADHLKFISREGGTGFHKLKKILTHDFDAGALVDFGFVDSNKFVVQFTLRTEKVPATE